jgi:hypothetical protein
MFSCSAKLLKYFANGPAKDVADLRSEILAPLVPDIVMHVFRDFDSIL